AAGTDSFDAISVSYSYLANSPWRLAFYGLIALIYGVISFLIVRFFVWLVLIATHTAVGLFVFRDAAGVDLLDALWPRPGSFADLSYDIDFINLTLIQSIAAVVISIFIYLIIGLLTAFALSMYVSMSTIVYFLMRRVVDMEEMDVVYLDPADEEYDGYADVPHDPESKPETGELSGEDAAKAT
ncbi:MAG: hypothetical protein AAGK78_13850, partial [Planctomycetota bacterium]